MRAVCGALAPLQLAPCGRAHPPRCLAARWWRAVPLCGSPMRMQASAYARTPRGGHTRELRRLNPNPRDPARAPWRTSTLRWRRTHACGRTCGRGGFPCTTWASSKRARSRCGVKGRSHRAAQPPGHSATRPTPACATPTPPTRPAPCNCRPEVSLRRRGQPERHGGVNLGVPVRSTDGGAGARARRDAAGALAAGDFCTTVPPGMVTHNWLT